MNDIKTINEFLTNNKDKPKKETMEEMMIHFGISLSTAKTYYSTWNAKAGISSKSRVYIYLDEHPEYLVETKSEKENNVIYKSLGVSRATFYTYKSRYKAEHKNVQSAKTRSGAPLEIPIEPKVYDPDKYYKGRLRQKFRFNV